MNNRIHIIATLALLQLAFADAPAQTSVPHDFQAGQPAKAAEVNENFTTLETAVNQNSADLQQFQGLVGLSPEAAQIQTALDLTSGLRWLIADDYAIRGFFALDNAEISATDPSSWSNRFVESATVIFGEIHILFGSGASEQIANRQVILRAIDPGNQNVWFDCIGDGTTDVYLAELDCAFSDEPFQPISEVRMQVLTALYFLQQTGVQQVMQDYYETNGAMPESNVQAGLRPPGIYTNKFIERLTVSEYGTITITFGRDAHPIINGKTIRWSPIDGAIVYTWICDSLDIPNKYLPIGCRR